MKQSLYERIGGAPAIKATVAKLYEKILADDHLNHFFENGVEQLRKSQAAFVTMAFGGPNNYTGKGLRKAHGPLTEKGLSHTHFDAVKSHLKAAMVELGVPDEQVEEAMSIVETTRNDVLCIKEEMELPLLS